MHFTRLTENEFKDYTLNSLDGNYLQTVEMKKLREKRGMNSEFYGIKNDAGEVVTATLISKDPLRIGYRFYVEGGPIIDFKSDAGKMLIRGLQALTKKQNGLYLTLTPYLPRVITDENGEHPQKVNEDLPKLLQELGFDHHVFDEGMSTINMNWVYKKDLPYESKEELFNSFGKDTGQYSIKQARKFGTKIIELEKGDLDQFKKITEETAERTGYQDKTRSYYDDVYETFGDRVKFIGAEINFKDYHDQINSQVSDLQDKLEEITRHLEENPNSRKKNNQRKEFESQLNAALKRLEEAKSWMDSHGNESILIAVAQFFVTPHEVTYVFAGSDERFKKLHAPYLIQEYMMNYALSHGISEYNFLGIDGNFDGEDGVFQFKKSFRGYAAQMIGEFFWTPRPLIYSLYYRLQKLLGRL